MITGGAYSDFTPTTEAYMSGAHPLAATPDFSLVLGGPLFQLLFRAHLAGNAMTLVTRRIIAFGLVTWVPLLALSLLDGNFFGGNVTVPFHRDAETHIRFLAVVPLLLVAELIVHERLLPVARTFLGRGLIPRDALKRFDSAVISAFRLRNAMSAEVFLLAFVYAAGVFFVWRRYTMLDVSTWYATKSDAGLTLSRAGMWYVNVSLPIFQFLLLRWYFRLFIWARFLWQVSRIRLILVPTHPDQAGGLGFLSQTVYAFSTLLVAHGAMLAAQIADRIFFARAALLDFKVVVAVMFAGLMCFVFGPLLVFSPQLARAKRDGVIEYGTLAERYVRDFDAKWLRGGAPSGEPLLGSSDVQSLADMGNSFSVVRSMRLAPITRDSILQLAAAVLVPLAPLLLTVMSIEDLARKLFGLVF
jgi:hypothetical protein